MKLDDSLKLHCHSKRSGHKFTRQYNT